VCVGMALLGMHLGETEASLKMVSNLVSMGKMPPSAKGPQDKNWRSGEAVPFDWAFMDIDPRPEGQVPSSPRTCPADRSLPVDTIWVQCNRILVGPYKDANPRHCVFMFTTPASESDAMFSNRGMATYQIDTNPIGFMAKAYHTHPDTESAYHTSPDRARAELAPPLTSHFAKPRDKLKCDSYGASASSPSQVAACRRFLGWWNAKAFADSQASHCRCLTEVAASQFGRDSLSKSREVPDRSGPVRLQGVTIGILKDVIFNYLQHNPVYKELTSDCQLFASDIYNKLQELSSGRPGDSTRMQTLKPLVLRTVHLAAGNLDKCLTTIAYTDIGQYQGGMSAPPEVIPRLSTGKGNSFFEQDGDYTSLLRNLESDLNALE